MNFSKPNADAAVVYVDTIIQLVKQYLASQNIPITSESLHKVLGSISNHFLFQTVKDSMEANPEHFAGNPICLPVNVTQFSSTVAPPDHLVVTCIIPNSASVEHVVEVFESSLSYSRDEIAAGRGHEHGPSVN